MAEAEQAEVASQLEAEEHALSTIDLAIENVRHDDEVPHSCLKMPLSFSSGGVQISAGRNAPPVVREEPLFMGGVHVRRGARLLGCIGLLRFDLPCYNNGSGCSAAVCMNMALTLGWL
jgi:hypothetical protein